MRTDDQHSAGRIVSIDIMRGAVIILMLFVNDLAGVKNAPWWLLHMPGGADGMTIADIVFPAFLLITGMSMPFSLGRRLERGAGLLQVWKHVIVRCAGLLIIGIFMVNTYEIGTPLFMHPNLWSFLVFVCIFIIWARPGKIVNPGLLKTVRIVATIILVLLALLYRREGTDTFFQMRTSWWGILGLIGWAYLAAALFYIPFRKNRVMLGAGVAVLYCFFFAFEAGVFSSLQMFRNAGSFLGSHAAVVLSGAVAGSLISGGKGKIVVRDVVMYGLAMFVCGYLLHALARIHPMFMISKNGGTVPWCLLSSAYTVWVCAIVYYLVDIKEWRSGTGFLQRAGKNPLMAYMLEDVAFHLIMLFSLIWGGCNVYTAIGSRFVPGLIRAVCMSLILAGIAGKAAQKGFFLKL